MNAGTRRRIRSLFRVRRWYRQHGWVTTLVDARLRAELAR